MDTESIFPGNIVHSQVVIDSLVRKHHAQLFRIDAEVLPLDVPVKVFGVLSDKLLLKFLDLRIKIDGLRLDLKLWLIALISRARQMTSHRVLPHASPISLG